MYCPYDSCKRNMFNNLYKLLKQFEKKERMAEGTMNMIREEEQEEHPEARYTQADIENAKYQTWMEAELTLMDFIDNRENELRKNWTVLTEDSDSYPDSCVYVYAEDECGETYVAACDPDLKWYVTIGEQTHYIPDYVEIVRWCPLDSIKPRDLSWPMELAETLAVEVELVLDTLDCADASENADVLAEKVTDTLHMVRNSLYEIRTLLMDENTTPKEKNPWNVGTNPPVETNGCRPAYWTTLLYRKTGLRITERLRWDGREWQHENGKALSKEYDVVAWKPFDRPEPYVPNKEEKCKEWLSLVETETETIASEADIKADKEAKFYSDLISHKLDGVTAEIGINVSVHKGTEKEYQSPVFMIFCKGNAYFSTVTENGLIEIWNHVTRKGVHDEALSKVFSEKWDIISERIYKAKEEQKKAWLTITAGSTVYLRRPYADEKIISLTVAIKGADYFIAEENGEDHSFHKSDVNVLVYADKEKAEAYLKAAPLDK